MVWTGGSRGASMFARARGITGKVYKRPSVHIPMAGNPFMLEIRGFQAAARGFHYAKYGKDTMFSVYKRIRKIAFRIYQKSMYTCPMETGRLLGSANFIDRSKAWVGTNKMEYQFIDIHITYGGPGTGVEYAVYVHEGHNARDGSWVSGRPWLVRAARREKRALLKATRMGCEEVWKKYVRQINSRSKWQPVGMPGSYRAAPYGTGRAAAMSRMASGYGVTVTGPTVY